MGGDSMRVARRSVDGARRAVEVISEAWRERTSDKRARAAPRLGPDPRVSRSRLAAALDARLAVRAGVRLDDFLRHRLARYAARLPVPLEALPVTFDVEGGEAVIRPRPAPRHVRDGAHAEAPAFARALVEREGLYAARELRDAEAALDALDARAAAARTRLEALELELRAALASGQLAGAPDVNATAEQLGRPPVPPGAPVHALRTFAGVLVVAEAWRLSPPILAASGIAPGGIDLAVRAAPLPAALALAFALGAAAAAFTFAAAALSRAGAALDAAPDRGRRGTLLATAAAVALLVPGVAAAMAAPPRWADLVLLAVVPFAGALLWRAAADLGARRDVAADAALAWARERAREAIERGRRDEVLARAAADLAGVEAERAAARRRLQQLHRLAVGAERTAELEARAIATRLDRLSEGLAGALELDRYLYLRLAAERAHVPYERPARAARLEPAVATERLGVAG
jgi:hypothetical protein